MANSEVEMLVSALWYAEFSIQTEGWEASSLSRETWQDAWEQLNKFFAPIEIWRMVTEFGRGEAL